MTNEGDVKNMIDKTIAEFGRLDILVNNAGVLELGTIETTSLEQYDRVMNVNLRFVKIFFSFFLSFFLSFLLLELGVTLSTCFELYLIKKIGLKSKKKFLKKN